MNIWDPMNDRTATISDRVAVSRRTVTPTEEAEREEVEDKEEEKRIRKNEIKCR